ncbi:MAG: TIGR00730 family Rossman fold protein [Muribaculaceae bacterium]
MTESDKACERSNEELLELIPRPAITVYGASSSYINGEYIEAGRQLGRYLAEAGFAVVNGGGETGLMGAVNDGCLEAGGVAVGVIPRFMVDRGWGHKGLTHMIVTRDMHQRKEIMAACAQSAIALPGGVGTLEELLEIITWRQLGLYNGKIVMVNTRGYYDPLMRVLNHASAEGFMRKGAQAERQLIWPVDTPLQAVDEVLNPVK